MMSVASLANPSNDLEAMREIQAWLKWPSWIICILNQELMTVSPAGPSFRVPIHLQWTQEQDNFYE